jgi:hypothetical protein
MGATKRADESEMDRGQRLVDDTRKLIEASHRIFERNLLAYKEAEAMFQRRRRLVAASQSKIQQQGTRRRERLRRVLISVRIDEGRLPNVLLPIVSGAPGFGGECEACDGDMPVKQTVMAIPDGDSFVYLHADCYVIWRAQCHLRAALRRLA